MQKSCLHIGDATGLMAVVVVAGEAGEQRDDRGKAMRGWCRSATTVSIPVDCRDMSRGRLSHRRTIM
jgi:hypothetical protein